VLAASLLGLLLAAVAVFWLVFPKPTNSVAILPFENRIDDPALEYLSEGITDSLTNDLARIPLLHVSAHGSVLRYDGPKVDPLRAGRELKVERVVRGAVSSRAGELRIEAELMDVRSGARLWGHTYTTGMSSLPEALERFSAEVTDQLRLKLSEPLKQRLARQYAIGSGPYQDYMQARSHLNKRTPADFEAAVQYFNRAIDKNEEYAPAHAGLAYTYAQWAMHASNFGNVSPRERLEQARRAAQRALQLDSTLAEAYTSLAYVQMQADYQWAAAEQTFLRATGLEKRADALECYALELAALKRFDEALTAIKAAEDAEPETTAIRAAHATILYYARHYDDSLAILRPYDTLGDVIAPNFWAKSMPQEALAAVSKIPSTVPHLRTPLLVSAYARAGQEPKARALMAEYGVKPETAVWYYLALAHLDLGDESEALRDLERDYERRSAEILFVAVDPMMDRLRDDPRFRDLVARMKLN
jgi:serine/threonine-protein kinase